MCRVGAAADTLPLYYYHIPFMTGANYDMDDFLEAIHGRCPTFRGLKYTDFNLYVFNNCVRFADRAYDILYGRDEVRPVASWSYWWMWIRVCVF